jgi:hypothetical protein
MAVDRVAGSGLALCQRRQRSRFLRERLASLVFCCGRCFLSPLFRIARKVSLLLREDAVDTGVIFPRSAV